MSLAAPLVLFSALFLFTPRGVKIGKDHFCGGIPVSYESIWGGRGPVAGYEALFGWAQRPISKMVGGNGIRAIGRVGGASVGVGGGTFISCPVIGSERFGASGGPWNGERQRDQGFGQKPHGSHGHGTVVGGGDFG